MSNTVSFSDRALPVEIMVKSKNLAHQILKDLIEIEYMNALKPTPDRISRITYLLNAIAANLGQMPIEIKYLRDAATRAVDDLDYRDYNEREEIHRAGPENA